MNLKHILASAGLFAALMASAQMNYNSTKFHPIDEMLPTPNTYRTASGAPGHEYWQQQVDYAIDVRIDETYPNPSLTGKEQITYHNNSPDALTYLWVQLDQNIFEKTSIANTTQTTEKVENMNFDQLDKLANDPFVGGYKIKSVTDGSGRGLRYTINSTMMRIDLPQPLASKQSFKINIEWFNYINNARVYGGRGGCEWFEGDGNYIFEEAQWFPRLCVYDDIEGWQNKQYIGRGEFALEFGDYKVNITVPADHIVASTGELRNAGQVLNSDQQKRLADARNNTNKPILIVTPEEALKAEKSKSTATKTWSFEAHNVRDFAFASSRKFIWDAMGVVQSGKTVMAMSYYPKEGNPLWERYSTHAIAQTLTTYSKYSVDYPYPVAISVNGPIGGMEYPMICFNGPRPEADGTYSENTKYSLITVIIHEVGHNYFPMIISSDERQWTWMDEGLNTFLQYLTEKEWDKNYPARRGEPKDIVNYMSGDKANLTPIMASSESVLQFGNNAYGKPATALNILRETVMGRELFDFAFKTYCQRWAFKHPHPADFFRTMEDASAVDLDWFWRGWFYGTEACDIAMNSVKWYKVDSKNPQKEKELMKEKKAAEVVSYTQQNHEKAIAQSRIEKYEELKDFYNKYDATTVTDNDKAEYEKLVGALNDKEKALLNTDKNFYVVEFENIGGLVMPLIVEFEFMDGSKQVYRIPAEIWRYGSATVSKLFITDKEAKQITLDPYLETADIDLSNNSMPKKPVMSKFQVFKDKKQQQQQNLMQQQQQLKK